MPYEDLWQGIEETFAGQKALEECRELLLSFKGALGGPLERPPPDAAHGKQVDEAETKPVKVFGQDRTLSQKFIDLAKRISEELKIDQLLAVELVQSGLQQKAQLDGIEPYPAAIYVFYTERKCLLRSLLELVTRRYGFLESGDQSELAQFVVMFVEDLCDGGLPLKLVSLVTTLMDEEKQVPEDRWKEFVIAERYLVAQILFFISIQYRLKGDHTVAMLEALCKCAKETSPSEPRSNIFQISTLLSLSLVSLLGPSELEYRCVDPSATARNPLLDEDGFAAKFRKAAYSPAWEPHMSGFQGVVLVAWASFAHALKEDGIGNDDHNEQESQLVTLSDKEAFMFMAESMMVAPCYHEKPNLSLFCPIVLDGLVVFLLERMFPQVQEMKNEYQRHWSRLEGEGAEQQYGGYPDGASQEIVARVKPRYMFFWFIVFISRLYEDQADLVHKYWRKGSRTEQVLHTNLLKTAGEWLNGYLFVAYCDMVAAFAGDPYCAEQAWNFLSRSHTTNPFTTWDHFFACIDTYCNEFAVEDAYQGQVTRELKEEDEAGLSSVLHLTQRVLEHFPPACTLMCQNAKWRGIYSLFGLLSSRAPPTLKAALLRTIAAFAQGPDLTNQIWQLLESSQMLQTVILPQGRALASQESGIKYELEEVESRREAYDETRAFVHLLSTLASSSMQPAEHLGSGLRAPGFEPYLLFVRDHIFLKYDQRGYQDPGEKWRVAAGALKLFHQLIEAYDLCDPATMSDFTDQYVEVQGQNILASRSPGFILLSSLLSDSPFLKKILEVLHVHTTPTGFLPPNSTPGGQELQEARLYALKVLELGFQKQALFMECLQHGHVGVRATHSVTAMDRLMMSNSAHIIRIASYVGYLYSVEVAYYAVKLLFWLEQCRVPLVEIFLQKRGVKDSVMLGFVTKLRSEEPEILDESEDSTANEGVTTVRQAILELLLGATSHAAPNLAHMLLGYDVEDASRVEKTILQDRYSSPTSCLHVMLELILTPSFQGRHPDLHESCVELVHRVSSGARAGPALLRFLRARKTDFFYKAFRGLKTNYFALQQTLSTVAALNDQAWLCKTIALELHQTGIRLETSPDRSHASRLLAAMFASGPSNEALQIEDLDPYQETWGRSIRDDGELDQPRLKMLELLNVIDVLAEVPPGTQDLLDRLPRGGRQAVRINSRGVMLLDVKAIHRLMLQEIDDPESNAALVKSEEANQNIQDDLRAVVGWNLYQQLFYAKAHAVEAWCEVIEVSLQECYELLSEEVRETVLFDLLSATLQRVASTHSAFATRVSRTVVAAMTKLRQRQTLDEVGLSALDASGLKHPQDRMSLRVPLEQLHAILRGIITGLVRNDTTQEQRGNMCVALVSHLQYEAQSSHAAVVHNNGTRQIIGAAGSKLLDVVCRDAAATHGQACWRIAAFATLDVLASVIPGELVAFLRDNGYLQTFISELSGHIPDLHVLLTPSPDDLNALWIFESKLSLLVRIAEGYTQDLVAFGITQPLCDLQRVLADRPDTGTLDYNMHLPPVVERYHQLLLPVLRLAVAMQHPAPMQARLGQGAVEHTLKFVDAHHELITRILSDRVTAITIASLQELQLVTSLFYHLAPHENLVAERLPNHATKFERLMLALFTKYSTPTRWTKLVRPANVEERHLSQTPAGDGSSRTCFQKDVESVVMAINSNLVGYCRIRSALSPAAGESVGERPPRILFELPALNERPGRDDPHNAMDTMSRPPSLTVLSSYLKNCGEKHKMIADELQSAQFKFNQVNELPPEDLHKIANLARERVYDLTAQQRQHMAQLKLQKLVLDKVKSMSSLFYIIENALLVLLRHLEYYFPMLSGQEWDQWRNFHAGLAPTLAVLQKLPDEGSSSPEFIRLLVGKINEVAKIAADRRRIAGY